MFWDNDGSRDEYLLYLLYGMFPNVNPKWSKNFLLKRIRKIGRNIRFSVREHRYLKQLLKMKGDNQKIKYCKHLNIISIKLLKKNEIFLNQDLKPFKIDSLIYMFS